MKLIKTIGGHGGTPKQCDICGGHDFSFSRFAWHCMACHTYFPKELVKSAPLRVEELMKDFDRLIGDLERITTNDINEKGR